MRVTGYELQHFQFVGLPTGGKGELASVRLLVTLQITYCSSRPFLRKVSISLKYFVCNLGLNRDHDWYRSRDTEQG